jgi:hypothetical protein
VRQLALLVALGCSHPVETKPPGDPPCAKVAHHLLDLMHPDPEVANLAKSINDMMLERCEHDGWTADAQQCMLAMKTFADTTPCEEMLTVAQRDALDHAIDEKFPRKPEPAEQRAAEDQAEDSDRAEHAAKPAP